MAIESLQTSSSQLTGLLAFDRSRSQNNQTIARIGTGSRIPSAAVDGAAFSVAQGITGEVAAAGAVNQQLTIAQGTVGVALAAGEQLSNTLIQARATLTNLSSGFLSDRQRAQYGADFQRLQQEAQNIVDNASFNGRNALASSDASQVVANTQGGTLQLQGQNIQQADIDAAFNSGAVPTAAEAQALLQDGGAFDQLATQVGDALNSLGGQTRSISNQISSNFGLADANTAARGAIADADLARDSTRLTAGNVRDQLSVLSQGITNRNRSSILFAFAA